jgi:hypothetical protein
MNAGPHFNNPKNRGPQGGLNAAMSHDTPNFGSSSGMIHTGIAGETRDLPGGHAFQQLTSEYGAGRHEAYDSPLAQPAYSEHGKVQVF